MLAKIMKILKNLFGKNGEYKIHPDEVAIIPKTGIITPRSGFTLDEVRVIKTNNLVEISGVIKSTDPIPQNVYTIAGIIPRGFRPSYDVYSGAVSIGGNSSIVSIKASGDLRINHRTGRSDIYWVGFNLTYFV